MTLPPGFEPQRVLLIRPSALGDVSRTVPVLVSLKRNWPDATIDWLVHEQFAPVIASHPDLGRAIPFDRATLAHWYRSISCAAALRRWLAYLKDQQYDLAIDMQGLFRSAMMTWATRASVRLGYANARELAPLAYNHRAHVPRDLHAVERMLGLLSAVGCPVHRDLQLYVAPSDIDWLNHWRQTQGPPAGGAYITLAPTAKWRCKCWPIEKFNELAQRLLHEQPDTHLVIVASPSEAATIAPLIERLANHPRVHQPRTDVGKLMAVIAHTRLLVCNDSAALHIAVGLAKPAVAIFGPTDPALVGPYRQPHAVVQPDGITADQMKHYRHRPHDQSLISQVPLHQVWQKTQQQLHAPPPRAKWDDDASADQQNTAN